MVGDAATYIPPPAAPARVLAAAKTSVHVDAEYGVQVAGMGAKYTSVVEEEGDEAVARPAPPVALPPRTAHLEGEAAHQAALFGGYGRAAPTLPEGVAGQKRARAYEELGAGTGALAAIFAPRTLGGTKRDVGAVFAAYDNSDRWKSALAGKDKEKDGDKEPGKGGKGGSAKQRTDAEYAKVMARIEERKAGGLRTLPEAPAPRSP